MTTQTARELRRRASRRPAGGSRCCCHRWKVSSAAAAMAAIVLCLSLLTMQASAARHPMHRADQEEMSPELAEALGLNSEEDGEEDGNSSSALAPDDGGIVDLFDSTTNEDEGEDEEDFESKDPAATLAAADILPFDAIFERKSRSWTSVLSSSEISASPNLLDPSRSVTSPVVAERDAFKFTEEPSAAPSSQPSAEPTATPSAHPSAEPTSTPSVPPSAAPSDPPTSHPTFSPTENIWITEPEPRNPRSNYFNYDPRSKRGPGDWDRVSSPDEEDYWREWQEYIAPSLGNNRCEDRGDRQSPIDVRLEDCKGQCFEYHQIRHKPGEYQIEENIVKKQILPSKLRFIYPIRIDPWASWATVNDDILGPSADVPKGWGHQLPVTHVDIKVPSEHWMEGKQYAAEYQIYLIQNRQAQRGGPAVSILLDLHPENKQNRKFQIVLDAFQEVWDYDMARCEDRMRKQRRLGAFLDSFGDNKEEDNEDVVDLKDTWLDEPEEEEVNFQSYLRDARRKAQGIRKYNPWTEELLRSVWFYGYEGSLTEPPCTEFIEWRVIDKPGLISIEQLHQLKKLLFWHVDKDCDRTSVHYEGSVARPLQPYRGRWVHRCMCRDFLGDKERREYGNNRCLWVERDQFGFDKDIYTQEWYDDTHKYLDPADQPAGTWQS